MNIENLDIDLRLLAEKKTSLSQLEYSNEAYDKIEEELHMLEDKFQEKYGEYLEEVISDIHDEFCPDNDVLLSIAYLAHKYVFKGEEVDVQSSEGVLVDVDDYPDQKTKLVLVPSPTRVILQVNGNSNQVVWQLGAQN